MLRSPGILPTTETIFTEINRSSLAGTIRKLKLNFNKNIYFILKSKRDFPGGSIGKESACNAGDSSSVPGWERSLEKGMATHSIIFAWKISWTEEPDGLQ